MFCSVLPAGRSLLDFPVDRVGDSHRAQIGSAGFCVLLGNEARRLARLVRCVGLIWTRATLNSEPRRPLDEIFEPIFGLKDGANAEPEPDVSVVKPKGTGPQVLELAGHEWNRDGLCAQRSAAVTPASMIEDFCRK